MLSAAEIPLLDPAAATAREDYLAGLELLAAVPGVRQVVPGHGQAGDAAQVRRRIGADRRYLAGLDRGEDVADPRLTQDWLIRAHQAQLRRAREGG
jgi:glyoxylase-like metal-dependent hydrolase (beta-lactamase superfamily II)